MTKISADVRLRSTRIGFLTSPTDVESIRKIMRINACLWGGYYNPIIPVFDKAPKAWKADFSGKLRPVDIAKGYIKFFEPDVFVEAEYGLAAKLGLEADLKATDALINLDSFLAPDGYRDWAELKFGLNMIDVLNHIYSTEQQFVRRDSINNYLVTPNDEDCIAEVLFGVYPEGEFVSYFNHAFKSVYKPSVMSASKDLWKKVFFERASTPLYSTGYGLDARRYWYHDLILYIFDATKGTDLIDLWNLRLEPHPVVPVPLQWCNDLMPNLKDILLDEYKPISENTRGRSQRSTIQFGRSIKTEVIQQLINTFASEIPPDAYSFKYERTKIWEVDFRRESREIERMKVTAKEQQVSFQLDDIKSQSATFKTIPPEFGAVRSFNTCCWVNVLDINYVSENGIAVVLPFNSQNRTWPQTSLGGEEVLIGTEGWVFRQNLMHHDQYLHLLTPKSAIVGYLNVLGIKAELSEPGHIAWQMLEQLDGVWGAHILADVDTLKLLNNMAVSLKRKSNFEDSIEESYAQRTASLQSWTEVISKRKSRVGSWRGSLSDYTKCNIIRLGLETDCPHCLLVNWHTLTITDYVLTCERCLKKYDFPQASLRKQNGNFTYRVIGPFSVPDFGRGSYSAILTLRALQTLQAGPKSFTFSTALNLEFDGKKCEVDFLAWFSHMNFSSDHNGEPQIIIGECKSLGKGELITKKDLDKLKLAASKLPNSIVVVSVLRDHFTENEIKLLKSFAKWGRRINTMGEQTNPLLLLTATELTADYDIRAVWRKIGGKYDRYAEHAQSKDILKLSDATQQLHLGLPSFEDEHFNLLEKAHKSKLKRAQTISDNSNS